MADAFPDSALIHPDFRVWLRRLPRGAWTEVPVYAAAVDMWRPRLAGHVVIPTDEEISLKITTVLDRGQAKLRPASPGSLRKAPDGSLRLSLSPGETRTVQFDRDPGRCLHLSARPGRLRRVPAVRRRRAGGLRRFGPGIHEVPGGILNLESDQTLQLDEGAILRASVVCHRVKNVVIRGLGMIDLLASCPLDPPQEKPPKQAAVKILHSRDVRVEGITVRNPSHYGILLGGSRHVRIAHVSIFTHCRWGDGIDSMACSDLRVERSFIRSSDDCLAVYADRGEFKGHARGHRYRHCTIWADVAHPVMVGVHGKHTPPGRFLEDLRFEHLTILRHCEASPMYQGCLALNPGDLNTVRDVIFSDIHIEDPEAPRLLDLRVLFNPAYNPVPGKAIHDILFKRLDYRGNPDIPSVIEGHDRHRRVTNIRVEQLRINGRRVPALPNVRTNPWTDFRAGA